MLCTGFRVIKANVSSSFTGLPEPS